MAISFLSDANATIDVYLTFDSSVELTDEDRSIYLTKGVFNGTAKDDAIIRHLNRYLQSSGRSSADIPI